MTVRLGLLRLIQGSVGIMLAVATLPMLATPASAGSIAAPTTVTGTSGANAQSVVTWSAPSTDGGSTITGYTVLSSTTSGGTYVATNCTNVNVNALTCTVSALTNGTGYYFEVEAINSVGTGPLSSPSAVATPAAAATVPGAPSGVAGTSGANAQSVVTWSAPSTDGGSTITGYTVLSSTTSGGTYVATNCTNVNAITCTVSGLTNGTRYTFTIAAVNASGTSAYSSASNSIITTNAAPGAPTVGAATETGNTTATLAFTPGTNTGSAITSYVVSDTDAATPGVSCASTTSPCDVTGLVPGQSYTFTIAAVNASGTSAYSSASNSITTTNAAPGAPTVGAATETGNTTATLAFTPGTNTGSAITSYVVSDTDAATPGVSCASTTSPCDVTGLVPGQSYTFTIAAVNASGTSAYSSASNSITTTSSLQSSGLTIVTGETSGSSATDYAAFDMTYQINVTDTSLKYGSIISYAGASGCYVDPVSGQVNFISDGSCVITVSASAVAGFSIGTATLSLTVGDFAFVYFTNDPSADTITVGQQGYVANAVAWSAGAITYSADGGVCTVDAHSGDVTFLETGTCVITAYVAAANGFAASSVTLTIAVNPAQNGVGSTSQSITWSAPATQTWVTGGTGTFSLGTATDTSGSTVTFTSSTQSVCTVSVDTVTMLTPGICTITSTASASGNYAATLGSPSNITIDAPLNAPTGAAATSFDGAVQVSWTNSSNASTFGDVTYTVTSSPGGATCTTSSSDNCAVTGLTDGVSYTFSVSAVSTGPVSSSASSASVSATPVATVIITTPVSSNNTELAPGTGQVTSNGTTTSAVVTTNGNNVTTTSGASSVTIQSSSTSTTGSATTVSVTSGGNVSFSGSGFAPGSIIDIYIYSQGTFLGTTVVRPDGSYSVSLRVPATLVTGNHTIQIQGVGETGTVSAFQVGVVVSTPQTIRAGADPITFTSNAPTNAVAGGTYIVSATAPGAIVTFGLGSASNGCSLSGNAVTFVATGTCVIQASVAANLHFNSATASQTFEISTLAPASPTGVKVVAGDRQVMVSWTTAQNASNFTGLAELVTAVPGGETCTTSTSNWCMITGLTNGVSYVFTVTVTSSDPVASPAYSIATPSAIPSSVGISLTHGTKALTPGVAQVFQSTGAKAPAKVSTYVRTIEVTSAKSSILISGNAIVRFGRLSTIRLVSGGRTKFTGRGFVPGTTVEIFTSPKGALIGTAMVRTNGTYVTTLKIPKSLTVGARALEVRGFVNSGSFTTFRLGVLVSKS